MNSTTTSKIASSKKDDKKDGFKGRGPLPPDRLSAEDYQMALHDSYDIGCATPKSEPFQFCGNIDFDHHLF